MFEMPKITIICATICNFHDFICALCAAIFLQYHTLFSPFRSHHKTFAFVPSSGKPRVLRKALSKSPTFPIFATSPPLSRTMCAAAMPRPPPAAPPSSAAGDTRGAGHFSVPAASLSRAAAVTSPPSSPPSPPPSPPPQLQPPRDDAEADPHDVAAAAAAAAAAVAAAAAAAAAGGGAGDTSPQGTPPPPEGVSGAAGAKEPPGSRTQPGLRTDIERMTKMLRLAWVRQYMLAGTLATDVGVLTNPAGMQAAVVCHAVDDHETAGSFGQRFLLVPAFGADGLSVGACVTQHSVRKHPLHQKAIFAADIRLGRWVRDDATGEWLVLTRSEVDNITRLMWIGCLKSTSRERITITCLSDVFDTGDIARSVLFECRDTEYRPCPLCGAPPGVCGGCSLPVLRPRHPLDLGTSSANLMAVGGGHWSGNVQVTVYGQEGLRPMLPSTTPVAHRCKYNQDEQLAISLQTLAISERIQNSNLIPLPSPVSADMRDLHQLAASYPDLLGLSSSGTATPNVTNTGPFTITPAAFEQLANMCITSDFSGPPAISPAALPAVPVDLTQQQEPVPKNTDIIAMTTSDALAMGGVTYPAGDSPPTPAAAAAAVAAAARAHAATGRRSNSSNSSGSSERRGARLQMTEKEQRAEERKVKNRIAAARSNARAREALEQMRTEIADNKMAIDQLERRKAELEVENAELKSKVAT